MTRELTAADLDATARRICEMIRSCTEEFNRLDAETGDGDMGSSLSAAARAVLEDPEPLPDDLGAAFYRLASAIAKRSGSSLSAIAMTGLMSLGKSVHGRTTIGAADFVLVLNDALVVMLSRSGAQFGDKTVLDGVKAIVDTAGDAADFEALGILSLHALARCVEEFRDRPSCVGRARLAPGHGIGLDDPGMIVLFRMAEVAASLSRADERVPRS